MNVTDDRDATLDVAPALAAELIARADEGEALGTLPLDLGSSFRIGGRR
jgi:hypothetical protein